MSKKQASEYAALAAAASMQPHLARYQQEIGERTKTIVGSTPITPNYLGTTAFLELPRKTVVVTPAGTGPLTFPEWVKKNFQFEAEPIPPKTAAPCN